MAALPGARYTVSGNTVLVVSRIEISSYSMKVGSTASYSEYAVLQSFMAYEDISIRLTTQIVFLLSAYLAPGSATSSQSPYICPSLHINPLSHTLLPNIYYALHCTTHLSCSELHLPTHSTAHTPVTQLCMSQQMSILRCFTSGVMLSQCRLQAQALHVPYSDDDNDDEGHGKHSDEHDLRHLCYCLATVVLHMHCTTSPTFRDSRLISHPAIATASIDVARRK